MPASDTTATAPRAWPHYTEPSFVDVDGLRTAYRRQGTGPTVLFLHGGGLTRMWLPFYARLAQRHDVIVPEHPGFGDTPLPATLQSFDDVVLHYDGLMDALELESVHLIGHSLGGWMAANLAVYYPRRFASLTLLTATGLRLVNVDSIDVFRLTPQEALGALVNGRGDGLGEYFVQEGEPEDAIRSMTEQAAAARLMFNPRYDHRLDHRLGRVKAPTLVLGAQDDRIVPTPMAARYAELIPGARLATIAGPDGQASCHLAHLEQPDEVAALIADHIAANA